MESTILPRKAIDEENYRWRGILLEWLTETCRSLCLPWSSYKRLLLFLTCFCCFFKTSKHSVEEEGRDENEAKRHWRSTYLKIYVYKWNLFLCVLHHFFSHSPIFLLIPRLSFHHNSSVLFTNVAISVSVRKKNTTTEPNLTEPKIKVPVSLFADCRATEKAET